MARLLTIVAERASFEYEINDSPPSSDTPSPPNDDDPAEDNK
jgi:hypothetical protein